MKKSIAFCLLLMPAAAAAETWMVTSSTLTYTVSHPLHGSKGVSHAVRGEGVCDEEGCAFLVAAPVNTFLSGDRNRDLHMIEVVRGAQFPMISVQGRLPKPSSGTFVADLEVEFAGRKAVYKTVSFTVDERSETGLRFHGIVPATLADFKITPPSLLGMPVKNEIPVNVEFSWSKS